MRPCDQHYATLVGESGIDPELVEARGYKTVMNKAELSRLGFGQKQRNVPALLVPTYSPDGELVGYQSKPDDPRVEDEREIKYETPGGSGVRLNIHPRMAERVQDTSARLWITEGAKKVDALATHGEAGISLQGVWCWRNKEGPLPEWADVPLEDREVYIVFDSDVMTKREVKQALSALSKYLHERGAHCRIVYLPDTSGEKVGVDDWMVSGGTVGGMLECAEESLLLLPDIKGRGVVPSLADAITATDSFAKDLGNDLYVYEGGAYREGGADHVRLRAKHLLNEWGEAPKWSGNKVEDVIRYIIADCPMLWEKPPVDRVNVLNGLLDVRSRELEPHTPEFLSPVQIPVRHDPEAVPEAWDRFIEQTFPEDAQGLAYELVGWMMVPDTSVQKAVMLTGEGSNGKSVYLDALSAFIGDRNISAVPLQKLEESRFSVSGLVGKLANICADLPSSHLSGSSTFKALTGGDQVDAERKYGRGFSFKPFARLLFSANLPPKSDDASYAFFRRWCVVPFERTFEPHEQRNRAELDAELQDPRELSGVLNRALVALRRVWEQGGLSEPESVKAAHEEFREVTDPLTTWLDRNTVEHPNAVVAQQELVKAYNAYREEQGAPGMSPQSFGKAITRARPEITKSQRQYNGQPNVRVYVGLGFKETQDVASANGWQEDRTEDIEQALGGW